MKTALLAAVLLAGTSAVALADQITLADSPPAAWDIAGTGNSDPLAISGGPFTTVALFDSDLGTASFGPEAMATTGGANGVFSVIAQTQPGERLLISFAGGNRITGYVDWASLDNGSLNPHVVGSYSYSASGDTAFLDSFGPSGVAPIDLIFETTAQTLENWDTDAGVQVSSGEINDTPSPVSEPSGTLLAMGLGLITAWWFGRDRSASENEEKPHG